MYKYILWDNDGVLVDTEPWYFAANRKAMAELGIALDEETYLGIMGRGGSCFDIAGEQGISHKDIETKRSHRNNYYQEFVQENNIEIPGVIPVLEELSQTYRMAIVTTARPEDFELIHRTRHILQYMDFVITNRDFKKGKPHPEPYLTGLSRFNAKPHEAIVIEDSSRGLKSAVAADLECIIVHNPFTAKQDFSSAKQIIGSIKELPSILSP